MIHMVDQIHELGPVYLHQMWTYERFMSTLNRYIHNRAYPEGSMIEAYTTEEAINCCTRYVWDGNAIGLPIHQHEGKTMGWGAREGKYALISSMKLCKKPIMAPLISYCQWTSGLSIT
jgi:hypothetical protein